MICEKKPSAGLISYLCFRTPRFITDAIEKRIRHDIFGYTFREAGYYSSIINWNKARHNWEIEKDWILFTPGVVPALNLCTLAFSNPGNRIIIQPPVYHPFFPAVEHHGRVLLFNQLREGGQGYEIDFTNMADLASEKPAMIIISNPHNPVGRAWTRQELEQLAAICLENGITIISDEIHCDLIMPGYRHIPMASISDEIASITITLTAPSKTFNIAGFSTSHAVISNPKLRSAFKSVLDKLHLTNGNIIGNIASEAAYTHGAAWVDELTDYLGATVSYISDFCNEYIPEIKPARTEATYLVWLDCRNLGMEPAELANFMVNKAGIGMNEGSTFGPGGRGFMRMNAGVPRSIAEKALRQLEGAVKELR
jgi:cystathionine beta-lyase